MRKWLMAGTAALLLVSGCNKEEAVKKTVENKVVEKEYIPKVEKPVEAAEELPYSFPLTGIGSAKPTDGRAVAVMINNHPKARPQSGLTKADIVYELLAEGDVTRFLAVFQSEKPEMIGPIRSARDYYIHLAKGLGGLYIAHGYSPEAKTMLNNGYIQNLNGMVYDGTLFKRVSFRKAPHNSYITFEKIESGAARNKYQMTKAPQAYKFLTEQESQNIAGKDAASVKVSFSSQLFNAQYEYDQALGKYKRFSNNKQTVDLDSKDNVLLDNILIVEAKHTVIDKSGRKDIDLKSGGQAYLFQKGKLTEVQWANKEGRIVPMLNGQEASLVKGKTWVHFIPTNPGLHRTVSFGAN